MIALIEKETGNAWFTCQWFYPLVLITELWLHNNYDNNNQTYEQLSNSNIKVINNHLNILKSKFNFSFKNASK